MWSDEPCVHNLYGVKVQRRVEYDEPRWNECTLYMVVDKSYWTKGSERQQLIGEKCSHNYVGLPEGKVEGHLGNNMYRYIQANYGHVNDDIFWDWTFTMDQEWLVDNAREYNLWLDHFKLDLPKMKPTDPT